MLEIKRDGSKVTIAVESYVPTCGKRLAYFSIEAGSDWAAGLLREHIATAIRSRIQAIRRETYEQGWRDHQKRIQKKTFFTGEL